MPHCWICGDVVEVRTATTFWQRPGQKWLECFEALYAFSDLADAVASRSWVGTREESGEDFIDERFAPDSDYVQDLVYAIYTLKRPNFLARGIVLNRKDFNTPLSLDSHGMPQVWGFPHHANCWQLLKESNPGDLDIQALFRLCRSHPVSRDGLLDFGHDYGGFIDWISTPGELSNDWTYHRPVNWTSRKTGKGLDPEGPMGDFSFGHILSEGKVRNERIFQRHVPSIKGPKTIAEDVFSRLPVEILWSIITLLPSKDVVNLRQASRRIASVGRLPDSFWASRFGPGHEFEHIYEAKPYLIWRRGQNQRNFMATKNALHGLGNTPYFRNRRRIWKICEGYHEVLRQMKGVDCEGFPRLSRFEPQPDNFPVSLEDRAWVSTSDRLGPSQDILYELFKIGLPQNEDMSVFVSTISLFGRQYVSGLRIVDNTGFSFSLGYVHRDNERCLSLHPHIESYAVSLTAAVDAKGVRGLALSSPAGAIESDWIGDHSGLPKILLPAVLIDPSGQGDTIWKGEFDGVRLVQFSASRSIYQNDPEVLFENRFSWWPEVPFPTLTPLFGNFVDLRVVRNNERLLPVCFKTFGGTNGELAHRLTGLTFVMTDDGLFHSIIMHSHKKKDDLHLGHPKPIPGARKDCFLIDGPGGERITGIDTVYRETDQDLVGTKIHTSFGNRLMVSHDLQGSDWAKARTVRADCRVVAGLWIMMTSGKGISNIGLMAAGGGAGTQVDEQNIEEYAKCIRHCRRDEAV